MNETHSNNGARAISDILADFRGEQITTDTPRGEQSTQSGVSPPIRVHLFHGLKTDKVGYVVAFDSRVELRRHLTEADTFPSKADCPMFSAGIFDGPIAGRAPTEFTLVVGEHDAGTVSVDEAIARLQKAGVAAFLYTSPSHTPESPRWRVVAPLQAPCGPEAYPEYLDLLNGALGGCLAPESADRRRRWFYGRVEGAAEYRVEVAKGGKLLDDLAATEHGITPIAVKPPKPKTSVAASAPPAGPATDADINRAISALSAIPNDGGQRLPYEKWRDLAMALHAATGGAQRALDALIDWTGDGQEAKTTAIWNGFRLGGGIGPGTLFKAAREAGWADPSRAPTAEGLENLAEPVDVDADVEAPRLVLEWIVDGWTDADLALLTARPALIEAVVAQLGEGAAAAREAIEKARQDLVVPADASTRDLRLPVEAFPYTKKAGKVLVPVNHSANYVSMLQRSGFRLAYDVIQKEMQVTIHGQALPKSDHEGEVLLRRATDLCEVNRISTNGLQGTLTALVAGNPVNPVVDYLSTLVWDGKPRFDALAASVEPSDLRAARAAFRIFLVQACAAADGGERGMRANPHAQPKYETVLVLQGEQGAGKTSGLRRLLPAPLRAYFQDGVTLALGDKDSERQAVSAWVTELGELEATFRRSEIERLKSFTSRQVDRMRVAYGRTDSKFQRRTVFVATANSEKVLTDLTGNRRFAVLSVTTMEIGWSEAEIVQLWAEAWHRYCSGEQWWPRRDDEEVALKAAAEQFETTSGIEERLLARYDWERGMAGVRAAERQSLVTILDVLRPGAATGREHTQAELDRARETIRNLWRRHGAKLKAGKLSVRALDRWTPIYAPDGKNRGYLLPPERGMADGVARFDGGGLL